MGFQPFELEVFQSKYEHSVEFNYSESGVDPVLLGELLELAGLGYGDISSIPLNYPEVNGSTRLREQIAAMYPGASAENVLVTVGASEANYLIGSTLVEPGDEALVVSPSYLQIEGVARNRGVTIKPVWLHEEHGWALDHDEMMDAISDKTRLISVVNPNNPTGHIFTEAERQTVLEAAAACNGWVITDEVYSGSERSGEAVTPTLYGAAENVIAVGSMSKAYGMPGLRCGWVVAPVRIIEDLWRRHDYTTVSASMLGNALAEIALSDGVREKLLARSRGLIRNGFAVLDQHLKKQGNVFSVVPPEASALSFVRLNLPMTSAEFSDRLRREKSVLLVPGECFGSDQHLRISSALPEAHMRAGFTRMNELVDEILAES